MTEGLSVDLAAEPGDRRVLRVDLRLRRVDRNLIVAVVDQRQQIALMDDLVVNHRRLDWSWPAAFAAMMAVCAPT